MADNEETRARFAIPEKAITALVRDIVKVNHPHIDHESLEAEFFEALHEMAERMLLRMFQDAAALAGFCGRKTIYTKDLEVAKAMDPKLR